MSRSDKRIDLTVRTKTSAARSPAERLEPGRAPARPRDLQAREPSRILSGTVRIVSGVFTVLLVAMVTVAASSLVFYNQYEKPGPLTEIHTVVIPKGGGPIEIAQRLDEEGVIANRWTFVAGHYIQSLLGLRRTANLKAGEYEFKPQATMRQVLHTLYEGKSILYRVSVPEGLTSQQIIDRLRAEPNLTGEIASVPPEGSLMPETYLISKGMARQELVERMQAEMEKFIASSWSERRADLPLRNPAEAVVFASIVEKETGRSDERDRVAAVFYNRLKKGMRLQSDPTIVYGLSGGAGALGRSITRTDIDSKTAYNTYQINGLPPGPICNPGRAAIQASLAPATTSDLYFVADGNGGHAFSETLKEHNTAVQKWREAERQAKVRSADDTSAATSDPDPDVTPSPPTASTGTPRGRTGGGTAAVAPVNSVIPLPVRKPRKE